MSAIEPPDEQLLAEYTRDGSADALAQLIQRHSTMVYATCLRILGERSQAEDAAQATFLVLMRKAKTLPAATVLASWLYYAAQNSAREIRRASVRRMRHEHEAAQMSKLDSPQGPNQISGELDDALVALPSVQRDAIVLRYFYGLSELEAAQKLRCPVQTLHTRVSRGVSRLRERFGQRGAVVSSVALSALLAQCGAQAAPAGLTATLTSVCAGQAAASATALTTAQGLLQTMALAKLKSTVWTAVLLLAVVAPPAYLGLQTVRSTPPQAPPGPAPAVYTEPAAPSAPANAPTLMHFDFEDLKVLPEWTGQLVAAPDQPANHCLMGQYNRHDQLTRLKIGDNAAGVFTYRHGAVLSFDYWVEEKVFALSVYVWDRTQRVSIGDFAIWSIEKNKWGHATVALSQLKGAAGEKLRDGSLIIDLTIQTGKGGGTLFVDNVEVSVPSSK